MRTKSEVLPADLRENAAPGCFLARVSVLAMIIFFCVAGCGSAPEVTSEKGLKCLDAVYTAVTSRKPELLDQCQSQIKILSAEGDLPPASFKFLEKVIQKASAGEWQTAAKELDEYIRQQNPR